MTATAHALIGGAIAASISNPAIGLPLAVLSHPLVDLVPHWDFGWGWKQKPRIKLFVQASFDLIAGIVLAFLFFGKNVDPIYLLAAIFLSEIWDILEAPYWFLHWKFPPFGWIYNIQSKMQGKSKTVFGGILTQIGTVLGFVIVLSFFH